MSDYIFNQHGVCTNPVIVHQETCKQFYGKVTVHKAPSGLWGFGLSIHIKFGNMAVRSSPPGIHSAKYNNMSEARKAGMAEYAEDLSRMLKEAKEWNQRVAESHGNDHGGGEEDGAQLSLF
ncbi:MAG: hypothetical protein JNM22_01950 [Saprospiraceae bacterium]|nr:hypothetical protein [Saprospiraceae bacterium]